MASQMTDNDTVFQQLVQVNNTENTDDPRCRPLQSLNFDVSFVVGLNWIELIDKQTSCRWFETLWRLCVVIIVSLYVQAKDLRHGTGFHKIKSNRNMSTSDYYVTWKSLINDYFLPFTRLVLHELRRQNRKTIRHYMIQWCTRCMAPNGDTSNGSWCIGIKG